MDSEANIGEVVVLTGAAGCLGYHTLKTLISHDHSTREVRCVDWSDQNELMKKQIAEELDRWNRLNDEKKGKVIRWIKGDLRDINLVEQVLSGADCVIHCAAKINVWSESVEEEEEEEMESINVGATETLLRACIRLGVAKFIHVSSFEVYASFDTIYYATESTLPQVKSHLFGPSGRSKQRAEEKVKQFSNTKLNLVAKDGKDSLNAIIIRLPPLYGEFDKYFVSRFLETVKFFGGEVRKIDNVWIRQQPLYAGNAAWSLIKAKQKMDKDQSISGEEFHITDETKIGDPFDFMEPFVACKGMRITNKTYPYLPVLLLLMIFFALKRLMKGFFFYGKGNRDLLSQDEVQSSCEKNEKQGQKRWTKASLRLDYEPLIDPEESLRRSLDWYKNHLKI